LDDPGRHRNCVNYCRSGIAKLDYIYAIFALLSAAPLYWQLIVTEDLAIFGTAMWAYALSLFIHGLAILGSEVDEYCPISARKAVPVIKIV